jgi:hypothetical protein
MRYVREILQDRERERGRGKEIERKRGENAREKYQG